MDVSISLLPSTRDPISTPDVAVVIDVLRATSVMATAIAANAKRIITCSEVAEARQWKDRFDPTALLCGERNCQLIDGFDLGNSPAEYMAQRVSGRTLVMTTTNGTRAIHAVQNANRIITASFLNITAVDDSMGDAKTVLLVCAGTDGEITGEDILLAGAIAQASVEVYGSKICGDDSVRSVEHWQAFQNSGRTLTDELRETAGGKNLVRYGFEDDLARCASVDSLTIVPQQITGNPPLFTKMNC